MRAGWTHIRELMITVMDMETRDVIVVLSNDVSFTTSVHTNTHHIPVRVTPQV